MKNKIFAFSLLMLAVLSIGAIPEESERSVSNCTYGLVEECERLYLDIDGVVRYQLLDGAEVVVIDRVATLEEIRAFDSRVQSIRTIESAQRLDSEVELGKKHIRILRDWAEQEKAWFADWDSSSNAMKFQILGETLRRNATVKNAIADLLVLEANRR